MFWHGEPTWSFLWRKVIPAVRDAGFRCIVPDQPGFGRSDKPTDLGWYSYDRFTHFAHGLMEQLDLRARRSSSTTGAGRSACAPPSSWPSASTGW